MKAKKALKRLTRVEKIISRVLGHCADSEQQLREFLDSAKASVAGAKKAISRKAKPTKEKKPKVAKATEAAEATPAPAPKKKPVVKAKAAPAKPKKPPVKAAKKPAPAAKKRRVMARRPMPPKPAAPDLVEGAGSEPAQDNAVAPQADAAETNAPPAAHEGWEPAPQE
jgi:hypothetical protein